MIITIDGKAGAGKTQMQRYLAHVFNMPIHRKAEDNIDMSQMRGIPRFLARLHDRHSYNWKFTDKLIIDEYWLPLWEVCSPQRHINQDIDKKVFFDFAMEALRLNDGQLPTCSLYLQITDEESFFRRQERMMKETGHVIPERNLELVDIEDPNSNTISEMFWSWISTKISNFHIIDAMQSANQTRSDVVEILRGYMNV